MTLEDIPEFLEQFHLVPCEKHKPADCGGGGLCDGCFFHRPDRDDYEKTHCLHPRFQERVCGEMHIYKETKC